MGHPVESSPEGDSRTPNVGRSSPRHYDFLDSLRAISALYVVMNHIFLTIIWPSHSRVAQGLSVLSHGHFAVCFFILLSGFCLMLPALPNNFRLPYGIGSFLLRRAWRIIPPYYFALLLSLLLIVFFIHDQTGNHWDLALPVTGHGIITHLLLIQDAYPQDMLKINHVFWSISVEWRIYFFFPLLLLCWRLFGPIWTTLATIVAAYFGQLAIEHYFGAYLTLHFLGLFAMGMFAAAIGFSSHAVVARFKSLPWGWITLIAGCFSALTYYLAKSQSFPSLHFLQEDEAFPDTAFGLFGACFLVLLSLRPEGALHRFLSFKPLVFIGSFAYSIYLIHAPLLQLIWEYVLVPIRGYPFLTWLVLVVLGLPIILSASYLFYRLCEEPFFKRRRNRRPAANNSTAADPASA